jgi:hypothetical protein
VSSSPPFTFLQVEIDANSLLLNCLSIIYLPGILTVLGLGDVVGEYDGAGNLQAHYVQGLGLASRVDAAGPAAYYQFDAVGNTT